MNRVVRCYVVRSTEEKQGDGGVEDAVTAVRRATGNGSEIPRAGVMKAGLSQGFFVLNPFHSRPRVLTGTPRAGTVVARSNWDSRKGLGGMHRLGIPKHDLRPCCWRAWILAVSRMAGWLALSWLSQCSQTSGISWLLTNRGFCGDANVLHSYSYCRGDELVSSREMNVLNFIPSWRERACGRSADERMEFSRFDRPKIRSGKVRRSNTVSHQVTPGFRYRDQNCRIRRSAAGRRLQLVQNFYSKGCLMVRPHGNQSSGSPPNVTSSSDHPDIAFSAGLSSAVPKIGDRSDHPLPRVKVTYTHIRRQSEIPLSSLAAVSYDMSGCS